LKTKENAKFDLNSIHREVVTLLHSNRVLAYRFREPDRHELFNGVRSTFFYLFFEICGHSTFNRVQPVHLVHDSDKEFIQIMLICSTFISLALVNVVKSTTLGTFQTSSGAKLTAQLDPNSQ
jgi:hypothetical protein